MQRRSSNPVRWGYHVPSLLAVAFILLIPLFIASCATKLAPITEDMSSAQIIQKAQERSDIYDWKGAQYYYKALEERFPEDLNLKATAMYELAYIEYKQGHTEKARTGFQAVLALYSGPGGDSLPTTWKILSEKVMAKLPSPSTTSTTSTTSTNPPASGTTQPSS